MGQSTPGGILVFFFTSQTPVVLSGMVRERPAAKAPLPSRLKMLWSLSVIPPLLDTELLLCLKKRKEKKKLKGSQKSSVHSLTELQLKSDCCIQAPFLQTNHILLAGPFSPSVAMPPPAPFGGTEANHSSISRA